MFALWVAYFLATLGMVYLSLKCMDPERGATGFGGWRVGPLIG